MRFAFMMMVVDNRNVRASIKRRLPRGCCSHVTTTRISRQSIVQYCTILYHLLYQDCDRIMGLARSASYDFLTALTIEGQFVPQSTDLHNAILPPTQPQGCCSSKLTPQLELTLPLRCPIAPTQRNAGLPNSTADHGLP